MDIMECVFSRLKGRFGALRRPLDINLQNFHMLSTHVFFNIIFVKSTRVCIRRQSSCSHFIRQRLSPMFSKFIVKKSSYFSCFFCLFAFKLEDEYRLSGNRSQCSLVGIALEFSNSVFAVPSVEGEPWVEIIDDSSPMKTLAWKQRK